ncbi:hypothetical protein J2W55_003770 [Mucilaginibacter pocheonensis]|uniref:Uncharacterized protein n=1 Tax=Mucilaginibacter pocheonensis TaxID=398050 RepID=A0ABU1TET5_9SPHI|nr:hypothetical protein [Mucilaginibacter pocheonensis]
MVFVFIKSRTTQIYTKILEQKVSDDMNMLWHKLASLPVVVRTAQRKPTNGSNLKKAS